MHTELSVEFFDSFGTDIVLLGCSNKTLHVYDMNIGRCVRVINEIHSRHPHVIEQNKVNTRHTHTHTKKLYAVLPAISAAVFITSTALT